MRSEACVHYYQCVACSNVISYSIANNWIQVSQIAWDSKYPYIALKPWLQVSHPESDNTMSTVRQSFSIFSPQMIHFQGGLKCWRIKIMEQRKGLKYILQAMNYNHSAYFICELNEKWSRNMFKLVFFQIKVHCT